MIVRRELMFCLVIVFFIVQSSFATTYYVSTAGNDATGDGTALKPWRTLKYAVTKVPINQGHVIRIGAGTFIESGPVEIPLGISIEGAGSDLTIIKAASSFYYNPASPGYATDRFLLSLKAPNGVNGNQSLKNFTIDGDSKRLHGGIYVRYRNNVTIDGIKVQNTNFNGIWLWDVKDSKIINTNLINCAWGSTGYCSGALNLGNIQRLEVDRLNVNESVGYGIKAIGPSGYNDIFNLKIHDSRISVHPYGLWNNGGAPNIAIELWGINLVGCEIYNCYVDNTISLVNSNANPSTGIQTIRVHHNTFDLETRANGAGYGMELTVHDAEVDNNYFIKGRYGIVNWDNPMKNWSIHHNVFYAIQGTYPGEIVRSQWSGLHNVNFYNNTVEFAGDKTASVIGLYGGSSENVNLVNNLLINNNTSYSYYPNSLIHSENGATLSSLSVKNNFFDKLPVGNVPGTYLNNLTGDPKISRTGNRPAPYYQPVSGSPLIDAGLNVLLGMIGLAPDIGAFEYAVNLLNLPPQVSITSPANNTVRTAGSSVTIVASASDPDGTITKVEFFKGTTKLGEDLTSPYTFVWSNVAAGSYSLTAKATDNKNATTSSAITTVIVNQSPVVTVTSPANNSNFIAGSPVTVTANASDTDGTIVKVEFFAGTTKLGEDASSPYSFTWTGVAAGSYQISAKATDNRNSSTSSAAIAITVRSNQAPVVSIISPANNSSFTPGSSITFTASASDVDGTVTKVEFFNGTTRLGEDLTSPHAFTVTNVQAGTYAITARATDNAGSFATSAITNVTVKEAIIKLGLFAPDASLSGNMRLSSDPTASKGSYFSIPAGFGKNYTVPTVSFAQFGFQLAKTDQYFVWVRVKSPTENNQGFHVYDGKGNWTSWLAGIHTEWTWVRVTNAYTNGIATFPFTEGANILRFAWFHDNVRVDRVLITNDLNFTPSVTLGLDAADASLTGVMKLSYESTADNNTYFSAPPGSGKNYYLPPPANATFNFELPQDDLCQVWLKVKSPSAENQRYFVFDDDGQWLTWAAGIHSTWTWVKMTDPSSGMPKLFAFSQGLNQLQLGWHEENVQVDRVYITNDMAFSPLENKEVVLARTDMSAQQGERDAADSEYANSTALYPNPVRDNFTLQYESPVSQQARIKIISVASVTVRDITVALHQGANFIKFDTDNIGNGVYVVSFLTAQGESFEKKMVVMK